MGTPDNSPHAFGEKLSGRDVAICVSLYFLFALLIHLPGIADYLDASFLAATNPDAEATRVGLIADMAFRSPTLTWQIISYFLAVLLLNILPLLLLLASMRVIAQWRCSLHVSRTTYALTAILGFWMAVLILNKLFFPRSSFALLLPFESEQQLLWLGAGSLAVYALLGLMPVLWRLVQASAGLARSRTAVATAVIVVSLGVMPPLYSRWMDALPTQELPNIIVIGLDSASPLHMERHPGALPQLEAALRESLVFENALTPLGRTFPAWTSILTAKYPVNSGARFNLTEFDRVETTATLPNLLRKKGYTTIYAQDERKFNNIDETFGFDRTVGPTPGAAEFVLTKVADHPIANLALRTPWAQQMFPFIALNRASPIHYDPDQFVSAIAGNLPTDLNKPLFLAAHFCLAHYPYTWRTQGRSTENGVPLSIDLQHIAALRVVEHQVTSLLAALKEAGRLDNAILVILSDHGESLGYEDGRWVSAEHFLSPHDTFEVDGYTAFPTRPGFTGHGSDVLDRTQHKVLLAFRAFGDYAQSIPSGTHDRLASLVDVMPTLLGVLGWQAPLDIDGINLMDETAAHERTVPTETGIRFAALKSVVNVDESALLQESRDYYEIQPDSARLILKPERYDSIVATKDIAVHTKDWMLALLRKEADPAFPRVALLVHKPTGQWTIGGDRALIARAPLNTILEATNEFYRNELGDFEQTWAFGSGSPTIK